MTIIDLNQVEFSSQNQLSRYSSAKFDRGMGNTIRKGMGNTIRKGTRGFFNKHTHGSTLLVPGTMEYHTPSVAEHTISLANSHRVTGSNLVPMCEIKSRGILDYPFCYTILKFQKKYPYWQKYLFHESGFGRFRLCACESFLSPMNRNLRSEKKDLFGYIRPKSKIDALSLVDFR